jgi:prepilin-type N-terminal cleavage/methylation domain-containing protein
MMKRLSGFTLIELLIVVAIIAILAAIAVPNFLEAQTRSKVSRVKADQRSLATAIEAYYVDNNSYPALAIGDGSADKSVKVTGASTQLLLTPTFRVRRTNEYFMTLTTPVAYITSIFSDPFADTKGASFRYSTPATAAGWIVWSFGPDTDEKDSIATRAGDTEYSLVAGTPAMGYITDSIYSAGGRSNPTPELLNLTYDPTNGTTSNGDVYRIKQ